jgi:hypothetical protein
VVSGKFDMPKLERSLKRYAKNFGDTTAQAVIRWSIQTCRELALETQVWGMRGTRDKQIGAITADAFNVLLVVDSLAPTRGGKTMRATNQGRSYNVQVGRILMDESAVNDWIEINRTRRRARTAKLPIEERRVCSAATFKKAMKTRAVAAGMAKGGWIGAGNDIARAQQGQGKMTIGVNFLKYSQKHSHFGTSTAPQSGWSPKSKLTNRVRHTADRHVMSGNAFDKAHKFGLKKTINWYRQSLKALDRRQ